MLETDEVYLERTDGSSANAGDTIEKITGGVKNINTDHGAHHHGYGWRVSHYVPVLAGDAEKIYALKGPTTLFAHLKDFLLKSLGSTVSLEIIKGATILSNTGNIIPITNTNDNALEVVQSELREDAAYSGGTLWDDAYAFGSSTNQSVGLGQINSNPNNELITKNGDEVYIIRLKNRKNDDAEVYWRMNFYEEPKGYTILVL